jgi:hypothetical protein
LTHYDQLRRCLSFILWGKGDLNDLAPAFLMGRSRGTKDAEGESAEEEASEAADPGSLAKAGGAANPVVAGTPDAGPFNDQ